MPKSYVLTRVPATVTKNVSLTFDDGPSRRWTPQVLDILKANRMHATFFMIGQNARSYPRLVRRVVAEGHTVGNHTFSHPHMKRPVGHAPSRTAGRGHSRDLRGSAGRLQAVLLSAAVRRVQQHHRQAGESPWNEHGDVVT
jgi:peptidoglycan/xylan/chitin deacetylase (PgdA/CDA1 family)